MQKVSYQTITTLNLRKFNSPIQIAGFKPEEVPFEYQGEISAILTSEFGMFGDHPRSISSETGGSLELLVLVATKESEVIGVAFCLWQPTDMYWWMHTMPEYRHSTFSIGSVAVAKKYQRRGLGKALYSFGVLFGIDSVRKEVLRRLIADPYPHFQENSPLSYDCNEAIEAVKTRSILISGFFEAGFRGSCYSVCKKAGLEQLDLKNVHPIARVRTMFWENRTYIRINIVDNHGDTVYYHNGIFFQDGLVDVTSYLGDRFTFVTQDEDGWYIYEGMPEQGLVLDSMLQNTTNSILPGFTTFWNHTSYVLAMSLDTIN